jgi:hypothetical protein
MLAGLMALSLAQATAPPPTFAFESSDAVLAACEKHEPVCNAYVEGAFDSMTTVIGGMDANNRFCPPTGFNTETIVNAFIAFLKAHPEKRNFNAASNVLLAVLPLVTCPK